MGPSAAFPASGTLLIPLLEAKSEAVRKAVDDAYVVITTDHPGLVRDLVQLSDPDFKHTVNNIMVANLRSTVYPSAPNPPRTRRKRA